MCWNAQVSIITFLFGTACAMGLAYDKFEGPTLAVFSFTCMQFLEFLTWIYMDDHHMNRMLSYVGVGLIVVQLTLLNIRIQHRKVRTYTLSALAFLFLLFVVVQGPYTRFRMEVGENGHLIWYWTDVPGLWVALCLSFYIFPTLFERSAFPSIFITVTLVTSLYNYYQYKTWGSMWCYMSNILWFFMLAHHIKRRRRCCDEVVIV